MEICTANDRRCSTMVIGLLWRFSGYQFVGECSTKGEEEKEKCAKLYIHAICVCVCLWVYINHIHLCVQCSIYTCVYRQYVRMYRHTRTHKVEKLHISYVIKHKN